MTNRPVHRFSSRWTIEFQLSDIFPSEEQKKKKGDDRSMELMFFQMWIIFKENHFIEIFCPRHDKSMSRAKGIRVIVVHHRMNSLADNLLLIVAEDRACQFHLMNKIIGDNLIITSIYFLIDRLSFHIDILLFFLKQNFSWKRFSESKSTLTILIESCIL